MNCDYCRLTHTIVQSWIACTCNKMAWSCLLPTDPTARIMLFTDLLLLERMISTEDWLLVIRIRLMPPLYPELPAMWATPRAWQYRHGRLQVPIHAGHNCLSPNCSCTNSSSIGLLPCTGISSIFIPDVSEYFTHQHIQVNQPHNIMLSVSSETISSTNTLNKYSVYWWEI